MGSLLQVYQSKFSIQVYIEEGAGNIWEFISFALLFLTFGSLNVLCLRLFHRNRICEFAQNCYSCEFDVL